MFLHTKRDEMPAVARQTVGMTCKKPGEPISREAGATAEDSKGPTAWAWWAACRRELLLRRRAESAV